MAGRKRNLRAMGRRVAVMAPVLATVVAGLSLGTVPGAGAVGTPSVAIGSGRLVEGESGSRSLRFNVSISDVSVDPVTVDYSTAAGTATAGTDFVTKAGTLTIAAGSRSGAISIPIKGDTTVESNETFTVTLANPTGATLGLSVGTGTILNDDASAGLLVSIGSASAVEGAASSRSLRLTVGLSGAAGVPVSVDWSVVAGTATAGSDYLANPGGTLVIPAGTLSGVVAVAVKGDATVEGNEKFSVVISNASGATIGRAVGTGTIVNDD